MEEDPGQAATGRDPRRKNRARRVINRERHSKSLKQVEEAFCRLSLSPDHYLHHFPKDDRCEFCAKGLGTKTPAYGSVADDYVNEVDRPREIVVQDTLQVSKPDIHGNHWYQVSEDVYSEYPRIEPHMTKEAEVVWDATAHKWSEVKGTFKVAVGASSRDLKLKGTMDNL